MRVTIDIDLTPQEARTFRGLPDVKPMNNMIVEAMLEKAKDNIDTLADPERMVAQWMTMSGKGIEQFQSLMASAMGAAASSSKK